MIGSEALRKVILVGVYFVAVALAGVGVLSHAEDNELPKDTEVSKNTAEEAAQISNLDYTFGGDFSGDGYGVTR